MYPLKGHIPLPLCHISYHIYTIAENFYFELNLSPLKYNWNLGLLPFAPNKIDFKTTAMYVWMWFTCEISLC